MTYLFAAVLAITWSDFNLPDYEFSPGDVVWLCETSLRDLGPKDSIYESYCDYEPWMEQWIGSGSGPFLGSAAQP